MPFWYDSKVNDAGAVLNVEPKAFNSRFMVKVEEPKPIEIAKAEVTTIILQGPLEPTFSGGADVIKLPPEEEKDKPILLDVGGPPKKKKPEIIPERVLTEHDQ